MELEEIMLIEISHVQKHKGCRREISMWKIGPKNKHMHKNKHDHIHIDI
jgi:2-iminoacetate synthase ThiH